MKFLILVLCLFSTSVLANYKLLTISDGLSDCSGNITSAQIVHNSHCPITFDICNENGTRIRCITSISDITFPCVIRELYNECSDQTPHSMELILLDTCTTGMKKYSCLNGNITITNYNSNTCTNSTSSTEYESETCINNSRYKEKLHCM